LLSAPLEFNPFSGTAMLASSAPIANRSKMIQLHHQPVRDAIKIGIPEMPWPSRDSVRWP